MQTARLIAARVAPFRDKELTKLVEYEPAGEPMRCPPAEPNNLRLALAAAIGATGVRRWRNLVFSSMAADRSLRPTHSWLRM
jgi:hypothetical protein